jgi:hypothetical protein
VAICVNASASLARKTRQLPIPRAHIDLSMKCVVGADVLLR